MSEYIGQPVLPTYTYGRVYKKGAVLAAHTDRPACEVSLTLNLDGDQVWPIFIRGTDGAATGVILAPGDAALYLGCVGEHWRNRFEGTRCAQAFLHYVLARGEHATHYFDRLNPKDAPKPEPKRSILLS